MDLPAQRFQPLRALLAALVWLAAAAVVLVIVLGEQDPVGVTRTVDVIAAWFWNASIWVAVAAAIAALLWPPFVPWLRVQWQRIHDSADHDPGLVREAVARLEHFDNGPDRTTIGKELLARHDFARAIPQLVRAVELEPDSLTARQLLGRALLGAGQAAPAAQVLSDAVRRDEDHGFGDTLRLYGEALAAAGQDDEAERVLARHEHKFGPMRSVDLRRAQLAARRGEAARARELLERAAAPVEGKRKLPPEEALARGRARVRRWFGGAPR